MNQSATFKDTGLCIGGPLDGRRRAILNGTSFRVPVRENGETMARDYRGGGTLRPEPAEFADHVYEQELLHDAGGVYRIWRHRSIPVGLTVETLISGYRAADYAIGVGAIMTPADVRAAQRLPPPADETGER